MTVSKNFANYLMFYTVIFFCTFFLPKIRSATVANVVQNNDDYSKCNEYYEGKNELIKSGYFPWHAAVYDFTEDLSFTCGATIISPYVLVSAAHCFYNRHLNRRRNAYDYFIIVGEVANTYDDNFGKNKFYYLDRIIFKSYHGEISHYQIDMVLLVTKNKMNFSKEVSSICLMNEMTLHKRAMLDVPILNSERAIRILMKNIKYWKTIQIPYVCNDECANFGPESLKSILSRENFCIGGINVNVLGKGLSGNGLVVKNEFSSSYQLVGIVSIKLVHVSYLALCTSVPILYDWIETEMKRIHAENDTYEGLFNPR